MRRLDRFTPPIAAELAGRPALAASISLVCGISSAWHPANALFLLALLLISWKRLVTSICIAASFLGGLLIAPEQLSAAIEARGAWHGEGRVSTMPSLSAASETCLVDTGAGVLQLAVKGPSELALGQRIELSGRLLPLRGDFGQRLLLEGVVATVSCRASDVKVLSPAPAWFEWSNALRDSFLRGMSKSDLEGDSLLGAISFGTAGALSPAERNTLARTGVAHVLTASGLQVFLLGFLAQVLMSLFPIPRSFQLGIVCVLLCFYATATGLHVATIRAVVVTIVCAAAYMFRREPDFLSALGLAALLTVVWQPWSIYTPGFQISYISVAALSLFWKPFWERRPRKLIDKAASRLWFLARTSLVASFAVAPLTAYHFGQISAISPVTNLLVAPALPAIVLVALLSWPLGLVVPAVQAGLLKFAVLPLTAWVEYVVNLFGSESWSALQVPSFNPYWLVLYYGAIALLWHKRSRSAS